MVFCLATEAVRFAFVSFALQLLRLIGTGLVTLEMKLGTCYGKLPVK